MTIRQQAEKMGNPVAGKLRRIADDVFTHNGVEIRSKQYVDEANVVYAVNWKGEVVYIAGEDFVI